MTALRILVVDDSAVFRSQLRKALGTLPGVEIAGVASNGRIALQMLEQRPVELVTLDLNMPDMGGLETLQAIKSAGHKAKVIVFAAKSARSAIETVEALRLGADDFVVKPDSEIGSIEEAYESIASQLLPRVSQFMTVSGAPMLTPSTSAAPRPTEHPRPAASSCVRVDIDRFKPRAVVIASSTGGPNALEVLLSQLPSPPSVPVLIAQHMPATFTKHLARHLTASSKVEVREGIHGEPVVSGIIYMAPGDFHMRIGMANGRPSILLDQGPRVNSVRPAADLLFASAAEHYGPDLGAFVLTGMGEDGLAGARAIKAAGGGVVIQDKESSVVWGMPAAVHAAGAFDRMTDIKECARLLARLVSPEAGR